MFGQTFLASLATLLLVLGQVTFAQTKKQIQKADDLPRLTYQVDGTAVGLVTDASRFQPFANRVRADVEKILAEYDIQDKTTLKGFKETLLAMEMLADHPAEATRLIAELRELEDKPSAKLMLGLFEESRIAAKRSLANEKQSDDDFHRVFEKELSVRLAALPWSVVESDVKNLKARFEIVSQNLLVGIIQSRVEPALKETGTLSGDTARRLVDMRSTLQLELPLKESASAALSKIVASHTVKKTDIWKSRGWDLSGEDGAKPVILAIWDSGVDIALFPKQQFENHKEQMNQIDDDGNGFVDDVYGIAYDIESVKAAGTLQPLKDAQQRLPTMKNQIKGFSDLQASIDSPEAGELKKTLAALQPESVKPFLEDLGLMNNYSHGTHVAGIAAAGNPFARLLVARITFDHQAIPLEPTEERARREAELYRETVEYFKVHQVRVVNMSWGGGLKDIESALEANGVGKDAARRAELARRLFKIARDGLYEALQNAPGILFICSAGNSDNDNAFEELMPSSFQLPNLLTVGAVDQAGDRTSFTTFGKNVDVYANGFEVESYIPGGDRIKFSGTSMASPNVANLAAKLIATRPTLKPAEVIALIKQGSEKGGSENFPLINPSRTVQLVR